MTFGTLSKEVDTHDKQKKKQYDSRYLASCTVFCACGIPGIGDDALSASSSHGKLIGATGYCGTETNPAFEHYLMHAQSAFTTNRYLEFGRAGYVEVGDEAVYVGEDTVPLLGDAVQADDGDDLLWRLLHGDLASGRVNLHGLARGHV